MPNTTHIERSNTKEVILVTDIGYEQKVRTTTEPGVRASKNDGLSKDGK